jgi:hypothetical protein
MNDEEREIHKGLIQRVVVRRADGQRYRLSAQTESHWLHGVTVKLLPCGSGRTHWKSWERFKQEFRREDGRKIVEG